MSVHRSHRSDTPSSPGQQHSQCTYRRLLRFAFHPRSSLLLPRRSATHPNCWDLVSRHTLFEILFYGTHCPCCVHAHILSLRARCACYRFVLSIRTSCHKFWQSNLIALPIHSPAHALYDQKVPDLRAAYLVANRTDAIPHPRCIQLSVSRPHPGRHSTTVRYSQRRSSV